MRSAPTLKSWMMPFSSVAMIEKLALVRIAFCSAPAFSSFVRMVASSIRGRFIAVCALGHSASAHRLIDLDDRQQDQRLGQARDATEHLLEPAARRIE